MAQQRRAAILCALFWAMQAPAQTVVPFVSDAQRLMVFSGKRFVEVDARPPKQVFAMNGALLFHDAVGMLCYFDLEERRTAVVERAGFGELQVQGDRAAWTVGDTLKVLRSGAAKVVATGIVRFTLSDSLLVFHDSLEQELAVLWRGQRIPLATVEKGSQGPQWSQGGNTVCFYDRSRRTVSLFHHGRLRTLTDSTDVGQVTNGTDIVAYWDDVRDEFLGGITGTPQRLSGLRPISAQAGDGVIGYVDGTLKLVGWSGGPTHTLTDSLPAQFWVKDQLLLYLWRGRLMVYHQGVATVVEDYVPEQWQVRGDLLVYLDINRELRGVRAGKRIRFGKEANISSFQLFGEAVVYRSPTGPVTIVHDGRRYTF